MLKRLFFCIKLQTLHNLCIRCIYSFVKPRPNDRNIVGCNMLRAFGHRVAMCCDMLGVVGSSLKLGKFEPTTPNMVAKRSQQVAPNNVATCCVGILRSFGRGFTQNA